MDKYNKLLNDYSTPTSDAEVRQKVEKIIAGNLKRNSTKEVYTTLFSCIDLTTLNTTDHHDHVVSFTQRVNDFETAHGDLPNVAAVCIFPNYVASVRSSLEASVNIAAVAAGFPSSQTFTEIKVAETALAVTDGADEIDIVLHVGNFLNGNYEELCDEISEVKESCRNAHLKVILETGALKSSENIKKASILSIYSGADFIKTSTGKMEPAATLEAAYVMCETIREYNQKTGIKIGFKPAGGIVTAEDAVRYYCIVEAVLGREWLNKELFRLGASRLANNLLSEIKGEDIKFF